MNNPFQLLEQRVAYQNEYIRVHEDQVIRPNGTTGPFSWLEMKHGAMVLAMSEDREVWLVREYKYAVGRPSLEVIGGGVDPGETPLEAAKRELKEEAGLTAHDWTDMGILESFTTMIKSPNYMFLARGIEEGSHDRDEGEVLEIVRMPLSELVNRVVRNEITHGPTCCLALKTAMLLGMAGRER